MNGGLVTQKALLSPVDPTLHFLQVFVHTVGNPLPHLIIELSFKANLDVLWPSQIDGSMAVTVFSWALKRILFIVHLGEELFQLGSLLFLLHV